MSEIKEVDVFINFFGGINQVTIGNLIQVIVNFSRNIPINQNIFKKAKSFNIFINSPGGMSEYGISFYNFVKAFNNSIPINVYNIGFVDSAGVLVFCSGDKRYALPESRFVIHEGVMQAKGELKRIKDMAKLGQESADKTASIIAESCKKDEKIVKNDIATHKILTSTDAKEYGLVDEIIKELPTPSDDDIVHMIAG